jgi:ABC-type transport system involved in multi-copper enzyme maturation permease subunit
MNPLVKKEIRLLLPAWIAAMLLAIIPTWIAPVWSRVPPEVNLYVQLAFALGFLLLAIASFGQEFGSGTFAVLLSQPVERRRLWFVKTVILAGAFVSVLLALLVSWTVQFNLYDFALYAQHRPTAGLAPDMSWSLLGGLALFAVVCFSSGLWTTLLLRRILEAFWLTLLTPLAIMVTVYAFHEYFHWSNQTDNYVIPAILLLYSVAGFLWARRLFLRAQDLQWTGGVITFSSRKRISTPTKVSSYPRHWFSALAWKELQLQQVNILIAAVVLTLHLASVVIRQIHPDFDTPNVRGLLELIWVLWLAMPLVIGSAAVAEEHRVGVTESQFCLPVSRRVQFAVKFFMALILSLVLGGLMPFVVERGHDLNYYIFIVAVVIFFISFYASTLARTTLQAIGLTLILSVIIYLYLAWEAIATRLGHNHTYGQLGLILLKICSGIPILLVVLGYLTFRNFKWPRPDGKLWRQNLITVLAAFAAIFFLSHAIYFRAWELLMPFKLPHGPARLNTSQPAKLGSDSSTLTAVLPDGRLWIKTFAYHYNNYGEETPMLAQCKAQFIRGSNWTDTASGSFGIVAIQSDGRLWFIPEETISLENGWYSQVGRPAQIGSDTNWLDVTGGRLGGSGCLLLKKDGTLWNWGTNWASRVSQMQALNLATSPTQIGNETNWAEVLSAGNYACAKKNDSSLWLWQPISTWTNYKFHLIQNSNMVTSTAGFSPKAEVRANGELWFSWGQWTNDQFVTVGEIQLGQNAKWKAVTFANNSLLVLRNDGTLWRWAQFWDWNGRPRSVKPVEVGNYSGWIALGDNNAIALAADGNLWAWGEPSRFVWLAPSRKPVFLGNIFGNAD